MCSAVAPSCCWAPFCAWACTSAPVRSQPHQCLHRLHKPIFRSNMQRRVTVFAPPIYVRPPPHQPPHCSHVPLHCSPLQRCEPHHRRRRPSIDPQPAPTRSTSSCPSGSAAPAGPPAVCALLPLTHAPPTVRHTLPEVLNVQAISSSTSTTTLHLHYEPLVCPRNSPGSRTTAIASRVLQQP